MGLSEAEAKEREREADAERGGGELLGEQDQPDWPEQVERPGDRAGNENCGERALRGALRYPFQMPTSLKYLIAPGWCGRLGCALPACVSSNWLKFGWPATSPFLFSRIALANW
jgi:hypothetical protein